MKAPIHLLAIPTRTFVRDSLEVTSPLGVPVDLSILVPTKDDPSLDRDQNPVEGQGLSFRDSRVLETLADVSTRSDSVFTRSKS